MAAEDESRWRVNKFYFNLPLSYVIPLPFLSSSPFPYPVSLKYHFPRPAKSPCFDLPDFIHPSLQPSISLSFLSLSLPFDGDSRV